MLSESYYLELLAREKKAAFEAEAQRARLVRSARKNRPGIRLRMMNRAADFLISLGKHIKEKNSMGIPREHRI